MATCFQASFKVVDGLLNLSHHPLPHSGSARGRAVGRTKKGEAQQELKIKASRVWRSLNGSFPSDPSHPWVGSLIPAQATASMHVIPRSWEAVP